MKCAQAVVGADKVEKMNSRERLLCTLNHKEPDRVPLDIGGTLVSSISHVAYLRLREYLGLPKEEVRIFDEVQGLAQISPDMIERLNVDARGVFMGNWKDYKVERWSDENFQYFKDMWGITWRKPVEGGYYYDHWNNPIQGDDISVLANYPWPDPFDRSRWSGLKEQAARIRAAGYPVILGSCGMTVGLIQTMQFLQGYVDSYTNMAGNPEFTGAMLDKLTELDLQFWEVFLEDMGEDLDVVLYADDFAGQNGLLISPKTIDTYFRPRYRQIWDLLHKKAPTVKTLFHSCGAIAPFFIELLIDIGVEIVNPVQVSAAGMDTKKLKQEYGKDIVFWGGGVDTQKVLPRGTPEEVREEVKRRLDDLMPGGGFVFATVHNIQADVPPENIMAMWETLQEYGQYS